MNLLGFIVVSGLALAGLLLAAKRPKIALYVVIFLAPWQGLDSDFGLRVTAHQIVLFMLLVVSVIRSRAFGGGVAHLRGKSLLLVFVSYAVVWSLAQLPFLPETVVEGGTMRGPTVRALVQIFMFLFLISPVFIVPLILRTSDDLLLAGKVFVSSAVCLAVLGWLQLAVWYFTGRNPMPIGLMDSLLGGMADVREGMFELAGLPIYRMSSLAGEPKNLGASLVIGMILVQVFLAFDKRSIYRLKAVAVWTFLAISAAATMSTTALYLWILGTMALAATKVILALLSTRRPESLRSVVVASALFLIGLGVSASYLSSQGESGQDELSVSAVVYARTIGRDSSLVEDFDAGILKYLSDHPVRLVTGLGLGNVHLHADPYLAPEVADFASGTAFSAKAGYLKLVSELGLVGLLLFVGWIGANIAPGRPCPSAGQLSEMAPILSAVGLVATILYLSAASIAPQFFLIIGVIAAGRQLLPEVRSTL